MIFPLTSGCRGYTPWTNWRHSEVVGFEGIWGALLMPGGLSKEAEFGIFFCGKFTGELRENHGRPKDI